MCVLTLLGRCTICLALQSTNFSKIGHVAGSQAIYTLAESSLSHRMIFALRSVKYASGCIYIGLCVWLHAARYGQTQKEQAALLVTHFIKGSTTRELYCLSERACFGCNNNATVQANLPQHLSKGHKHFY